MWKQYITTAKARKMLSNNIWQKSWFILLDLECHYKHKQFSLSNKKKAFGILPRSLTVQNKYWLKFLKIRIAFKLFFSSYYL